MEEKSLMIGNLVFRTNKHSGKQTIHELTASCLLDISSNGDRSSFVYEPIPLTEEWLVKMGFVKKQDNSGVYLEKDEHRVYLFSETFEFELTFSNGNRANLHRSYNANVHTLQNLYFSLIREELTIKTDSNE